MEEPSDVSGEEGLIGLSVLPRFLIGDRRAIAAIANSRWTLLLGALFCLSAGFAREYDGDDLLREPWHLVIPLGASLATSFVLYLLLYLALWRRSEARPAFGENYLRFLSLYWMTAPLAWVYALPVEQFYPPPAAMAANLWLLAIVAAWRVALITRCAVALFGADALSVFTIVMLFADTVAFAVLAYTPLPILNIMGGIRLSETESLILGTAFVVVQVGGLTMPVWLIGSLFAYGSQKPQWSLLNSAVDRQRVARPLWGLAAASILVWAAVLPYSQPPQQLKSRVVGHFDRGDFAKAVELMAGHDRDDFPAGWNPPPWPGYGQDDPPLTLVLIELIDSDITGWVRDLYVEKLLQKIDRNYGGAHFWGSLDDDEIVRYTKIFRAIPAARESHYDHHFGVLDIFQYGTDGLSEERMGLFRELQSVLTGEDPSNES